MPAAQEIGAQYLENNFIAEARGRGVEFEPKPVETVVITGYSAVTGFGRTQATLDGIWAGQTPIRRSVRLKGMDTQIVSGLPKDFDPFKLLLETDKKLGFSKYSATSVVLAREALEMADLLGQNGKIDTEKVNPYDVATCVSSGYAATDQMIEVHRRIHPGSLDKVTPDLTLQIFPEQNRVSQSVGAKGSGINSMEACATGAASFAEAYYRIKRGDAKVAIAGAVETVVDTHWAEAIAAFSALQEAMSKRNDDPGGASRPFDTARDGFVPGSGGAMLILEPLEHALARRAKIYGRVINVGKSMDAGRPTEMDPIRVADTIGATLYDANMKQLIIPDAFFKHATSTPPGDKSEVEAYSLVFQRMYNTVPATAIKSELGHILGPAGALNILAALHALQPEVQSIPIIRNLENVDSEIADMGLNPVRGEIYVAPADRPIRRVLAGAHGFGGNNTLVFIGEYREISMAVA